MIFLALAALIAISVIVYALRLGIGPNPTSRRVSQTLLEAIPADARVVVDLGSGWGSLGRFVAKALPTSKVSGYELSPFPWFVSKLRHIGKKNLSFHRQNFYKVDLADKEVVLCYLFPRAMEKLGPKLKKELKPGAIVISHTFAIPGWEPTKKWLADDLYTTPVYLYQVDSGQQ